MAKAELIKRLFTNEEIIAIENENRRLKEERKDRKRSLLNEWKMIQDIDEWNSLVEERDDLLEENKNLKEKVRFLEECLDRKEKLNEEYRKQIDKYKKQYQHSMWFMEEDTLQELKEIWKLKDDELIYEEWLYD